MKVEKVRVRGRWANWLRNQTNGYNAVVEFGAGFFDNLGHITNPIKIGIEMYKPYIDNAHYKNCVMIHGNMLDYETLLTLPMGPRIALFVDSLEHLEREDAFKLMEKVKRDFDKIIIMVPSGNFKQTTDNTGYDNHVGQTHKSFWFEDDLFQLGMTNVVVDKYYHRTNLLDQRCYFATWQR